MGCHVWVQFSMDDLGGLSNKDERDGYCDRLVDAILSGEKNSIDGGYTQIIPVRYADVPVLMFAFQNSFYEIPEDDITFYKLKNITDKKVFSWAYYNDWKKITRIFKGYTSLIKKQKKEIDNIGKEKNNGSKAK